MTRKAISSGMYAFANLRSRVEYDDTFRERHDKLRKHCASMSREFGTRSKSYVPVPQPLKLIKLTQAHGPGTAAIVRRQVTAYKRTAGSRRYDM